MKTYLDSSAVVPLYVAEVFSDAADAAARAAGRIPFTALHDLEVLNAFDRLAGRDAIAAEEREAVQDHLQEDLDSGRLARIALDLDDVFREAGELSGRYAAKHLARNLDLLHVAAAHAAGCTKFVSADDRQLAVAKASGLDILDIKRPSSRRAR